MQKQRVLAYLKTLGKGKYLFGQVATWVHNENPDMDQPGNWIKKVYDHTGMLPCYGCVTYDFVGNRYTDDAKNKAVKKMWDRGMLAGIYSWYAPPGKDWRTGSNLNRIFAAGNNAAKKDFYAQMDRMARNLQWLRGQGIPVIYTPFVESDIKEKWHARQGPEMSIGLYRLVHDYFVKTKCHVLSSVSRIACRGPRGS